MGNLQFRRGTATELAAITPLAGEPIWTTDTNELAIGDGSTLGGVSLGGAGTVTSVALSGGTTGLTVSGSPITTSGTITIAGTLGIANGGTGLTGTPTNGQLLIGNGSGYTLATLTAGPGVTITYGSGSISIAATGSSGSTVTKTADYTATTSDNIILVDATSGNLTITLYTAVGNQGKTLTVKKIDSSSNTVTIDPNSTETIDGSSTAVIYLENLSLSFTSDNANWYIY